MPTNTHTFDVTTTPGGVLVSVPYARAESYQSYFKKEGIGSTLHLDPANREARLELRTNLSAERVQALLAETRP